MKYLIAGLGNIGDDYEQTRHNVGFEVLDRLASEGNTEFQLGRHAYTALVKHRGRTLILVKPTTFVNKSGTAINYWLQKEKINKARLLVVLDDLALPFGTLRMRGKGNDGGHNGLKNINNMLATQNYPRLRFGIGDGFMKGQQVDFVLSSWTEEETKELNVRLEMAKNMVHSFCIIGVDRTMSEYNNK